MAERIEGNKVAKITGHKSEAAAKVYQGHITARILSEMGSETASEFRSILQYQRIEPEPPKEQIMKIIPKSKNLH
jgi:hypothetical protein